ncbi:MAG: MATE family efflux transporter [Lachnospiraceae bacterium]|nr:MATE family efflux transporter [Lachnospiraceae bacterium]
MSDIKNTKTKNTTDMTVGNPVKHILIFALPLFIGKLFQQFYNMVDSVIVGKYINADALAATGSCGSLSFLFFSLSAGLAIGIGIIVAQYFGAGDSDKIRETISSSFYVLTFSALVVTAIGFFLARPILVFLNTPEGPILENAVVYLRTTVCGIFFIAIYNGVSSVLRALGDSKTPLIFLIISSFLNVGMDLLLVIKFDMGVFGVALATVIAQAISALISLIYAFVKVPYFRLTKSDLKPNMHIIGHSFRLGIPLAIQSSMIAISLIVLQRVVNGFGHTAMSAFTITSKVDIVVSMFYNAISSALTTYCGQNFGAKQYDRVKGGYKLGMGLITIYNIVVIPVVFIFARLISGFFVNEPEVIELSIKAIHITRIMYLALGLIYVPRGTLNGVGDANFSLINGLTEVVCRVVFSYALTRITAISEMGIWYATGLTWLVTALICNLRYFSGIWYKKPYKEKQ